MDGEESAAKRRMVRKFSAEQRAQAVADSLLPDARVREVAARHGVRPNLLSYWRRRARGIPAAKRAVSAPRFAALKLPPTADAERGVGGVLEIDWDRRCVRVRGIVDAGMLREVLAATR